MQYVSFEKINKDGKDVKEGEIFTVFKKDQSWAFCMRIGKDYTLSTFKSDKASAVEVKKSMQQIQFAKKNGWSGTGIKDFDEDGAISKVYHCLYCRAFTMEVEGPCACRGIPKEKTTPGGLLLPEDW